MIIDFHTHIFPEKVAEKAIPKLAQINQITPSTDGTLSGILDSMKRANINTSVILPVVTGVEQFDSIIRFASHINETFEADHTFRLISFGGIHPEDPLYKEHLQLIAREGLKGIKLHPCYQNCEFHDIKYKRLIYTASEFGLSVITHSGYDPYTPEKNMCTPDMILDVLHDVMPPKLILAHLGNNVNYHECEEKLIGQNVWIDTAYSILHIEEEQLTRMIHNHGVNKVLFASDTPWADQEECVKKLLSLSGLSTKEKQQILYENSAALLNL